MHCVSASLSEVWSRLLPSMFCASLAAASAIISTASCLHAVLQSTLISSSTNWYVCRIFFLVFTAQRYSSGLALSPMRKILKGRGIWKWSGRSHRNEKKVRRTNSEKMCCCLCCVTVCVVLRHKIIVRNVWFHSTKNTAEYQYTSLHPVAVMYLS